MRRAMLCLMVLSIMGLAIPALAGGQNHHKDPPKVTSTCDSVTIEAAENVKWAIQIGDGYVDGEGNQAFSHGQPGQFWAVYYKDKTIASGVFEPCSSTTTTPDPGSTTTTTGSSSTTVTPEDTTTTTTTSESSTSTTSPAPSTTDAMPPSSPPPSPPPTSVTTPPELPYTGPADGNAALLMAATLFVVLGWGLVRSGRVPLPFITLPPPTRKETL